MATDFKQSPLLKIALAVVLLAVLISFFRYKPKTDHQVRLVAGSVQEAAGQVAADQAAKVLGEAGGKPAGAGKILVILGGSGKEMDDPNRAYRSGFEAALKRHPNLSLAAVEIAPSPSPQSPENQFTGPTMAFYQRLLGQHADIACIVSFMQAPNLTPDQMRQWKADGMPKLISVVGPIPDHPWRDLIRQDILQVALIRFNLDVPETEPQGPYQQIFDHYYKMVTAENLKSY